MGSQVLKHLTGGLWKTFYPTATESEAQKERLACSCSCIWVPPWERVYTQLFAWLGLEQAGRVCSHSSLCCFSRELRNRNNQKNRMLIAGSAGGENSPTSCWGPVAASNLCSKCLFINYSWSIRVRRLFATAHNTAASPSTAPASELEG